MDVAISYAAWALVALIAVWFAFWLLPLIAYGMTVVGECVLTLFWLPLSWSLEFISRQSELAAVRNIIDSQVRGTKANIRSRLTRATRESQRITVGTDMVKANVEACNGLHWLVARTQQLDSMTDAALHPVVTKQRQRVTNLMTFVSSVIERYPFTAVDPKLAQIEIALEIGKTACENCPFLTCTVTEAQQKWKVCPSGQIFGVKLSQSDEPVSNAQ